jgi:hypothetical protein
MTKKRESNGRTHMPTDRAAIRAFLESALADGGVPVRDLEARARAAGLLPEGLAISQCKPIRKAANKLHILRYRDGDHWVWELPSVSGKDAQKMPASADVVQLDAQVPPVEDLAAARRKFIEESMRWYGTAEFKATIKQGLEEAEEIVRQEYARLGLDYASRP